MDILHGTRQKAKFPFVAIIGIWKEAAEKNVSSSYQLYPSKDTVIVSNVHRESIWFTIFLLIYNTYLSKARGNG